MEKKGIILKIASNQRMKNRLSYRSTFRLDSESSSRRVTSREQLESCLEKLKRENSTLSGEYSYESPQKSRIGGERANQQYEVFSRQILYESSTDSLSEVNKRKKFRSDYINIVNNYAEAKFEDSLKKMKTKLRKIKKMKKIKVKVIENKAKINRYHTDLAIRTCRFIKNVPVRSLKNRIKPTSCKNAVFVRVGKILVLVGNSAVSERLIVWRLNVDLEEWTKVEVEEKRIFVDGCSAIEFNGKICVFGGKLEAKASSLLLYDYRTNEFSVKYCTKASKVLVKRYHCCFSFGTSMVIYGGIDSKGRVSNETWVLDLLEFRWEELLTTREWPFLSRMAYCMAVGSDVLAGIERNSYDIYTVPKINCIPAITQGVYLFGGEKRNQEFSSDLLFVEVGKGVLDLKTVQTRGKSPSPRANSSLEFVFEQNTLLLYGGNNKLEVFSDLFCLRDNQWNRVELSGDLPGQRTCHSSCCTSSKLILFGGVGNNIFLGGDCYFINVKDI